MITALSAVVMGVCAIAVALYQAQLMRSQQAAEVWPHLTVSWTANSEVDPPELYFSLQNSGVGPARIRWAEVRLDGAPVTSWHALGAALTDPATGNQVGVSFFNGRVIIPGEPLTVARPIDPELTRAYLDAIGRIDVTVCYCSIRDDCWMSRLGDWRNIAPVAQCPADDGNTFAQ